jgi:hypothetical protein
VSEDKKSGSGKSGVDKYKKTLASVREKLANRGKLENFSNTTGKPPTPKTQVSDTVAPPPPKE